VIKFFLEMMEMVCDFAFFGRSTCVLEWAGRQKEEGKIRRKIKGECKNKK